SVMMCSIRGAGCWPGSRAVSAGEEVKRDGYELLVVLEDPAVAGVGVDDELAARDPAVQVLGEHGGHHPVVVAVRDQCGLGDRGQVGGRRAPPALDRLELRSEEHTSELQSLAYLVCRLLLEKKKKIRTASSGKSTM